MALSGLSSNLPAPIRITLPEPHEGQARLQREHKRFNVVACGRRWGKTKFASLNLATLDALGGKPVGWFAPTFKILDDAWREMRSALAPVIAGKSETTHRMELISGGIIECWSLTDEDAGRSRKYARALVDEAGLSPDLGKRWNEAIRPTLVDLKGDAWFFGTPKGRNFFWEAFTYGQDAEKPDWASWRMPTSTNPYIEAAEIEAARKGMPDRSFRQEFLAEFLEDAGGVFRGVAACVDSGRTAIVDPTPTKTYYMGVDLARVEDFTVISVLDEMGRQVYHDRFNQISWEIMVSRIVNVATKYGARVVLDSTGVGDPIFETLRKASAQGGRPAFTVQGYTFNNASKEQAIDNLAMLIERQDVRLMDIPVQTNELQAYQYELTPSRNVRMNAPEGMHDDCVIALALSAWALRDRPRKNTTSRPGKSGHSFA